MMIVTGERETILERARAGDRAACEALLRPLAPALQAMARARLAHDHDAQDVVQETLARAIAGLGAYRPDASFEKWVFTIAVNAIRDLARRRRTREERAPEPPDRASLDPAEAVGRAESVERILAAMRRLDPGERAPLLLHLVHGLPQIEVAELLDLSVEHLRVRYFRAIRKIRGFLKE